MLNQIETRGARLLIVDDALGNLMILSKKLGEQYQVQTAQSGQEALDILENGANIDLILLDVMMPEMDGYEVCRRLKQDSDTQEIPIIFVTSRSRVQDEAFGLSLGAVDYITKPFSIAIVRARVRTHVELKRSRDHLRALSQLDGLTGISNRRRFDEVLEREWRRCMRRGDELSLMMIDIDRFKDYNDSLGHPQGDRCIQKIAQALTAQVRRSSDELARYGGEEFAAILPNTSLLASAQLAESMCQAVRDLKMLHGAADLEYVSISIGVACLCPGGRLSIEDLLDLADQGLYAAKRAGRDRVMLAPGLKELRNLQGLKTPSNSNN